MELSRREQGRKERKGNIKRETGSNHKRARGTETAGRGTEGRTEGRKEGKKDMMKK